MNARAKGRRLWLIVAIAAALLIGLAVLAYERWIANVPTPPQARTVPAFMAYWAAYGAKVNKIDALLAAAPTSQPSAADTEELFDQAQHAPDFRVRVRALAVLPYLRDRDRAIRVLIPCLHDRDRDATGDGNVPLYASHYLADMKAASAVPDVEDWLSYLRSPACPYSAEVKAMMLKTGAERLATLKAASTQPTSKPA